METLWISRDDIEERVDAEYYKPVFVAAYERVLQSGFSTTLEKVWKSYNRIYIGIAGFDSVTEPSKYTPYIRPTDIGDNGEIDYEHLAWCENHWLDDHAGKGCAQPGDLILEVKGNTKKAAVINDRIPPNCIVSGSAYRIVLRSEKDAHFFQAFFLSEIGQTLKRRLVSNTTISYIDPDSFKNQLVVDPSGKIQHAIGNKFRKAERLRELAEAAKKQLERWLASAARQELATPEVSRYLNHIPAETIHDARWVQDLTFGDRLDPWPTHVAPSTVRNHLLSHGHTLPFDKMLSTVYRGKANPPAGVPGCHHVSILDVNNDGHVNWSAAEKNRYESAGIAINPGDILFPTLNPNETRVAVVPLDKTGDNAASSEFVVLNPRKGYEAYPFLIAAILRSPWVRVQVAFLTRSSSLSRRRIDDDDLGYIHIPWVDDGTLGDLNRLLSEAVDARHEAVELINAAKADIESLIDGTLDQAALVAEGQAIDDWLVKHPRPDAS